MKKNHKTLAESTAKAARIGLSGTIAKFVLQLAAQLVLLRLVSPSDYGVFAIAALCLSFANFLANAGLSAALIQKEKIDDEDVVCAFSWQLLLGATISAIVFLVSPFLGLLFKKPELVDVVKILSFVCLLNSASSVANSILIRDLRYFAIHKANLFSYAVGYGVVGIGLAYLGYGYFALACAWLSQSIIQAGLYYSAAPHRIGFSIHKKNSVFLISFGSKAIVTNLVNWWINSLDKLVVGRFYGAAETGVYSVAYNLVFNPLMQFLSTLQSVVFSASSKLNSDDSYRSAIVGTLTFSSFLFLPVFTALSLASNAIVTIVLGVGWGDSSSVLEILSISFSFISIQGLLTPYLWGKGDVGKEMQIQIVIAFIAAAVIGSLLSGGILCIAKGALLVSLMRLVLVLVGISKVFSIQILVIFQAILPGLMAAMSLLILGFACLNVAGKLNGGVYSQVLVIFFVYILVMTGFLLVFKRSIFKNIPPLSEDKLWKRFINRLVR